MISSKMETAFNNQIKNEMYSASLYLAMSAYCSDQNWDGFANWFRIQTMEEMTHAMKMYDFVLERDGRPVVPGLDKPPQEFGSAEDVFAAALEHERKVTAWINDMVDQAMEEKDHASRNFLNWFVDEQVEEEATAVGILNMIKMVGDKGHGLFMIDRQLAARVFTPPPAEE